MYNSLLDVCMQCRVTVTLASDLFGLSDMILLYAPVSTITVEKLAELQRLNHPRDSGERAAPRYTRWRGSAKRATSRPSLQSTITINDPSRLAV